MSIDPAIHPVEWNADWLKIVHGFKLGKALLSRMYAVLAADISVCEQWRWSKIRECLMSVTTRLDSETCAMSICVNDAKISLGTVREHRLSQDRAHRSPKTPTLTMTRPDGPPMNLPRLEFGETSRSAQGLWSSAEHTSQRNDVLFSYKQALQLL